MKKLNILEGPSGIPAIALGLMHMPALAKDEAARVLANAVDLGVNFFDEATCYAQGEAERRFGREGFMLLAPGPQNLATGAPTPTLIGRMQVERRD